MVVTTEKNGFPTYCSIDGHMVVLVLFLDTHTHVVAKIGWVCLVALTKAPGLCPTLLMSYPRSKLIPDVNWWVVHMLIGSGSSLDQVLLGTLSVVPAIFSNE